MNQTRRNRNIDIVRGVAVLGIFVINVPDMAYPQDMVLDFHATDPSGGWNYWVAFASEVLFAGKMRGLFTLLFGASSVLLIAQLTRKTNASAAANIYFRRLYGLLVLGLFNAYILLWWGDVLFKYALLGMLLFPLGRASNRLVGSVMLVCLAVLTVQPYLEYRDVMDIEQEYRSVQEKQRYEHALNASDQAIIEDWEDALLDITPDRDAIDQEVQIKSGTYIEIFNANIPVALEEQTSIFLGEDIYDMLLFMSLGIILLRAGFFNDTAPLRMHLIVAISGIGVGLAVHLWMNLGIYANFSDPVASLFYPIFFDPARLPFVLGYASLIILVFRMSLSGQLGDWIAAVGRLALTNYLLQSIVGALVFYGFGLAQFNQMSRLELSALVFLVWVFQITWSVIWLKWFCYGPAEWLWRSLTYRKAQSFRRMRF